MQPIKEFEDLFDMSVVLSVGLFVVSLVLWYLYTDGKAKRWVAELTTVLFTISMTVAIIFAAVYTQPSRVSLSDVPHKDTVNHLCEQYRRDSSLYGRR